MTAIVQTPHSPQLVEPRLDKYIKPKPSLALNFIWYLRKTWLLKTIYVQMNLKMYAYPSCSFCQPNATSRNETIEASTCTYWFSRVLGVCKELVW